MKSDEQSGLYDEPTRKNTAVDYLFKELLDRPKDKMVWYYILEKAKQMEKEQIKNASQKFLDITLTDEIQEEYYNKTYGKE